MKRISFRADGDYWDRKLSHYIHDPPDKALKIMGHKERSKILADAMGQLPAPNPDDYNRADWIASGMDRTPLPGYHKNASLNGAIDFLSDPFLTHPTGVQDPLRIDFEEPVEREKAFDQLLAVLHEDLIHLSEKFHNARDSYSAARFHYWHHVLRKRLAEKNVGGLGGLWYQLPADTRIPDHSIWGHSQLVSALTTCFELSPTKQASLLVFSITPVQDFINRARKLRDYWTGSLILSWLTFEAMRHVICSLGSDHIVYPSPMNQPLVDNFLSRELGLEWLWPEGRNRSTKVASLPNKFVCLVPTGLEEKTAEELSQSVEDSWVDLGQKTLDFISSRVGRDEYLEKQFERQMADYWDMRWASCPLVSESKKESVKKLLHETIWQKVFEFAKSSRSLFPDSRLRVSEGSFYGITHALSQAFLAAGKSRRWDRGSAEGGIKCALHGDMEILRYHWGNHGDKNPRPGNDPFWKALKEKWGPSTDFKDTERLSAVALVKRVAYRICKDNPDHPLSICFQESEGFPSSTEVALTDWFDLVKDHVKGHPKWKENDSWPRACGFLGQLVHERGAEEGEERSGPEIAGMSEEEHVRWKRVLTDTLKKFPLKDTDRYYAILVMDGDRMGRLIDGETLASSWESVIHPDLVRRLKQSDFDLKFRDFWQSWLDKKRVLSPAVHAAVSEALADFSLLAVPVIIEGHRGRLIYAGGDDVCAVLPVSEALEAARKIASTYSHGFHFFADGERDSPIASELKTWKPMPGRLARLMGRGEEISISAGVLICHHKKPLSVAMSNAQNLLKKHAKEIGGRNSLAIELDKRGGGSRRFVAKWDGKPPAELGLAAFCSLVAETNVLDHFLAVADSFADLRGRSISSSLIYRLEALKPGLESILCAAPTELAKFLCKQLTRSGTGDGRDSKETLAAHLAAVIARKVGDKFAVSSEALVVAKFLGESRNRRVGQKGGEP